MRFAIAQLYIVQSRFSISFLPGAVFRGQQLCLAARVLLGTIDSVLAGTSATRAK